MLTCGLNVDMMNGSIVPVPLTSNSEGMNGDSGLSISKSDQANTPIKTDGGVAAADRISQRLPNMRRPNP
jgi:hypothetical protein